MSAVVLVEGGRRSVRPCTRPVTGPAAMSPRTLLCPACGSSNVAQMLGDNGGVSYVCTTCGHSWG
ncbi:hypothetical protein [Streptomyces sp. Amel2xB2]|uniref:hypothetical protein n=1 Tax=Streptomyces sp. Amel2xB2 TaxID=1305829 RepID=UPI0011B93E86|nr:hypothetical protein [Streptomyces sp. Amel2xB2]